VIGSNRGLCSNFNRDLINYLIKVHVESSNGNRLIVMGDRLRKMLERKGIAYHHYFSFPSAAELTPSFTHDFFNQFILPHPDGRVELLFNLYRGAGQYRTLHSEVFPNTFLDFPARLYPLDDYVFDTGSDEIQKFLFEHLYHLSIYYALLSSVASEHSTRFQLMESASSNADRLAEELFIQMQVQRRYKITAEMQELAIGAGLLKKERI